MTERITIEITFADGTDPMTVSAIERNTRGYVNALEARWLPYGVRTSLAFTEGKAEEPSAADTMGLPELPEGFEWDVDEIRTRDGELANIIFSIRSTEGDVVYSVGSETLDKISARGHDSIAVLARAAYRVTGHV